MLCHTVCKKHTVCQKGRNEEWINKMKKILVVDDEQMNRMSTKFILSKAGYEVTEAASGEDGIERLKKEKIDLMLLDVEMPKMSGVETLQVIRGHDEFYGLKVFFLTASESEKDMADAIRLGAGGYIKKPCQPEELIKAVDSAFSEDSKPMLLAVDDEAMNRMMIERIFGREYQITAKEDGEGALQWLEDHTPDIILLDYVMPGKNGEEVFGEILNTEKLSGIPVVFLTADDDRETERRLFSMGAMDFIRKPFDAEIVRARVDRITELRKLQGFLQSEVDRKTNDVTRMLSKLRRLSGQIVLALSGAVDAKDAYTNGHSHRVAEYSRELAKRMGKDDEQVNDIYYAAMLHDVGKIGIPGSIINKPDRLTDEEFNTIKSHTTTGAKILTTISEMPVLSIGAHWHHERYDGKGYPDGLSGENIPEIARIICVADCYDAMSSNRSYRKVLPQDIVRSEIQKGKGTQFDPEIADIMLQMIDEDTEYKMREE